MGAVALAIGSPSAFPASPGAPTRGDAEAVFNGTFTGGAAILGHAPSAEGAPLGLLSSPDGVRINPLFGGSTYCAAGWHLISLGLVTDTAIYDTRQAAADSLASSEIRFSLDGIPLEAARTAVTVFTAPESFGFTGEGLGINFGAFLPPGALTPGMHHLETTISSPGFPDYVVSTTFTVVSC